MKQAEDELTAAAERIREIAKAATDPEGGPWLYDPDRAYLADAEATLAAVYDDDCGHHMALFDPSTALLVAELLEGEAARWAPRPTTTSPPTSCHPPASWQGTSPGGQRDAVQSQAKARANASPACRSRRPLPRPATP